jgi:hypothetical protein
MIEILSYIYLLYKYYLIIFRIKKKNMLNKN